MLVTQLQIQSPRVKRLGQGNRSGTLIFNRFVNGFLTLVTLIFCFDLI